MAVTVSRFWRTKQFILGGTIRLMYDELKMMLLKPGFTYDNGMVRVSDIIGLEFEDQLHYPVGGTVIEGKSIQTADNGKAEFYIGQVEWPYVSGQVQHAVVYANVMVEGIEKPLIAECNFGKILNFQSTLFRFTWPEPLIRW